MYQCIKQRIILVLRELIRFIGMHFKLRDLADFLGSCPFIPPTYTTQTCLDEAYYNFPNHNVPFFPLAGPWARGVALITPGSNRSEYATGRGRAPGYLGNRGGAGAAYR